MDDVNGSVSSGSSTENRTTDSKPDRREIPALLIEATPTANGLGHWVLASPIILFIGWFWVDLFAYLSPIAWYGLDFVLGILLFWGIIILPLGYAAHRLVTAFPRPFQHAGWDVQPLEPVKPAEQYVVRYIYREKRRAETTAARIWMRAAQGWVYLEIAAIFIGAITMIPLFFSAREFGFGQ